MKIIEINTIKRATGDTNCIHYLREDGVTEIDVCITQHDEEIDVMPEMKEMRDQMNELFTYFNEIFGKHE